MLSASNAPTATMPPSAASTAPTTLGQAFYENAAVAWRGAPGQPQEAHAVAELVLDLDRLAEERARVGVVALAILDAGELVERGRAALSVADLVIDLELSRKEFVVGSSWFSGKADVVTYVPEELLGTKLRALYQRKKGRDLFDMATALRRLPALEVAKVVDCFTRYLAHTGKRVSRAEYEANLAAKIDDPAFTKDILPLLTHRGAYDSNDVAYDVGGLAFDVPDDFDAAQAWADVHRAFITRLPGEPWKRPR